MYNTYNVDLFHFGDNCAPGIIIDDILNIHKKQLFMLAIYKFNDILDYLKENKYREIYDKKYFKIENQLIKNEKYNFIFCHDYTIVNNEITNYDVIKDRFEIKIKNFEEILRSEKPIIFISFSDNINNFKITDMLNWLKCNKKNFHLFIFTTNDYSIHLNDPNLSIIRLTSKHDIWIWWRMEKETQKEVFKEIYERFIECCKNKNIHNNFPSSFEETSYYINFK